MLVTSCKFSCSYLQILKEAISHQTGYEPGDNLLRCLPKIEIVITNVPKRLDSEPLELNVEGLNVKTAFQLSPGGNKNMHPCL